MGGLVYFIIAAFVIWIGASALIAWILSGFLLGAFHVHISFFVTWLIVWLVGLAISPRP